ncbi:MepB family protein [Moritella sp. 36]|uniref:MepB family protein n=1 Tax=Moritella sp. 36 TaxID=2746233 RepID=UPI001BA66C73|nr:MepB family protein [Moritella sp. 36]QUM88863.1 MepB family protein [Moritella sp. 36]
MGNKNYRDELESLLIKEFVTAGYQITQKVELDSIPESSKYEALNFSLNDRRIVYRKGKVTSDRPGAFLAVWQRPLTEDLNSNKPIPLTSSDLDYLFIHVESHSNISERLEHRSKYGMFIFPVSLLIEKGILASIKSKGKTGFRVFPPWSEDRGVVGTKVFSESGKKTQRWQIPFFLDIDENGLIDSCELKKLLQI